MPTFAVAEVSLPYVTLLPRDVTVNTFHFQTTSTGLLSMAAAQQIAQRLADFYVGVGSGSHSIANYLSAEVGRTADVRVYDPTHTIPRPIFYEDHFALGAALTPDSIPPEVALCASYFGDANVKRQRGRVYLGPFGTSALKSGAFSVPADDLIATVAAASQRLAVNSGSVAQASTVLLPDTPATGPADAIWSIRSKFGTDGPLAGGTYTVINSGWVDNEWDGQRRRRIAATARTAWTNVP